MLMLTAVVSFLVLSFAAACRGDFSGFGMIAEGILYIAGILLMCWLFTQPVLLGILIVIGIVIAYASYRNKKEKIKMTKIYFTLTGTRHYYGSDFLKSGMKIQLEKEPDNKYDPEAIQVKLKGMGKIGYVANSPYTMIGESMSAGRIYDKIDNQANAKVVMVTPNGTLCKLSKKSLVSYTMNEKAEKKEEEELSFV